MFTEHVELFRCLVPHEESWLVAAVRRSAGRRILDGVLGCPLCRAEYPVVRGVAWFGVPPDDDPAPASDAADDLAVRAAALLGLSEPNGVVALAGAWATAAADVHEMARVGVLLVNPPAGAAEPGEGATVVRCTRLPLGAGVLRGAALDANSVTGDWLPSALHAVRTGGRVVAPASVPMPADTKELARDDRDWVAERLAGASPPVPIRVLKR